MHDNLSTPATHMHTHQLRNYANPLGSLQGRIPVQPEACSMVVWFKSPFIPIDFSFPFCLLSAEKLCKAKEQTHMMSTCYETVNNSPEMFMFTYVLNRQPDRNLKELFCKNFSSIFSLVLRLYEYICNIIKSLWRSFTVLGTKVAPFP